MLQIIFKRKFKLLLLCILFYPSKVKPENLKLGHFHEISQYVHGSATTTWKAVQAVLAGVFQQDWAQMDSRALGHLASGNLMPKCKSKYY